MVDCLFIVYLQMYIVLTCESTSQVINLCARCRECHHNLWAVLFLTFCMISNSFCQCSTFTCWNHNHFQIITMKYDKLCWQSHYLSITRWFINYFNQNYQPLAAILPWSLRLVLKKYNIIARISGIVDLAVPLLRRYRDKNIAENALFLHKSLTRKVMTQANSDGVFGFSTSKLTRK